MVSEQVLVRGNQALQAAFQHRLLFFEVLFQIGGVAIQPVFYGFRGQEGIGGRGEAFSMFLQDLGQHVYGVVRGLDVTEIQPEEPGHDQQMPSGRDQGAVGKLEGDEEEDEGGGHDEIALSPGSFQRFPEAAIHAQESPCCPDKYYAESAEKFRELRKKNAEEHYDKNDKDYDRKTA
jgi:hypothetical protein